MQEEVTKHTKKIYHIMKDSSPGFWGKIREIGIEIFIIVFAVSLSIGLHNWSDHRHEQQETREFLNGLKGDLSNDLKLLEENKKEAKTIYDNFRFLLALQANHTIDTASEATLYQHVYVALSTTHPNIGRYEGFKSSGKIGTIEIDSLKQAILVYYQQNIPDVNDLEGLVNGFQEKVLDLELNRDDKTSLRSILKSFKMLALLDLGRQNLKDQIQLYELTKLQAQKIIAIINRSS